MVANEPSEGLAPDAAGPGDVEAFDRLIEPFRGELHAHCYRMLGSVQDAEDAVQEALVRAWRSLGRFEERGLLRAWLYKIATNRCLTLIERRPRRELPTDLSPGAAPLAETVWLEAYPGPNPVFADGDASPAARYEQRESVELAFVAALQRLPGRQRAVLVLREVLGFSGREVADLLETTVASVNSALQRARKVVRDARPVVSQQATMRALGDEGLRVLVERYVTAWQDADIDSIVAMLTEDATLSMPPATTWYRGREAVRAFLTEGPMTVRWRIVPVSANAQLAFGTYSWDQDKGSYVAEAIDLITLRGTEVAEITAFLTPESFWRFGLPEEIAR